MSWEPQQDDFRGLHAIFKAVRSLITENLNDVVTWANEKLELSLTPFSDGAVGYAVRHSKKFPMLVVEPSAGESPRGEHDLGHDYNFDVTLAIVGDNPDQLTIDLVGYLVVIQQLFFSATRADWIEFFEEGTVGHVQVECGPVSFEQLDQGEEETDLFVRGFGMTLTVRVNELMP